MKKLATWAAVALTGLLLLVALAWVAVGTTDYSNAPECHPEYVGTETCTGEAPVWQDSGDAPERGGPGYAGP